MLDCHKFKTGYLDESGDSGKRGSKSLVLTYMCTDDNKKIAKIMKKARKGLKRTKKGLRWLNKHGEIKFSGFPDEHLRQKILESLSKLNIQIKFIAIGKKNKAIHPTEKIDILKELIVANIRDGEFIPHKIIADKDYFDNKKIAYLIVKDYEEKFYESKTKKTFSCNVSLIEKEELDKLEGCDLKISIKQESSKQNINLQAVDLLSGAIFQEMEREDKTYTNLIRKHKKLKGTIKHPK